MLSDYKEEISYLSLSPILLSLPKETLHTITGCMLGDGHIRYPNLAQDGVAKGNARYEMTLSTKGKYYLWDLSRNWLGNLTNIKELNDLTPYPNITLPKHIGKEITQYKFHSRRLPVFTALHSLWYKLVDKSYVKIIPENMNIMFSGVSLAHCSYPTYAK